MRQRDHVQHVLEQWRREAPELDRSPMGVVGRISRLAQLLQAELEPIFAAHGVNGGEFDVLASLRRDGRPYRLTPTELSKALMVTSGGMTKRLTALEGRGLISREPDPNDGRSTTVSLTREGRRLVEAILPEHVENERRLLRELTNKERAELAGLLETLAVSLGDEADAPRGRRRTRRKRLRVSRRAAAKSRPSGPGLSGAFRTSEGSRTLP
jgi:DNA-binding MarR family transcriptional regulator